MEECFSSQQTGKVKCDKRKELYLLCLSCFLSLSDINLEEKKKVDSQGTRSEAWSKTGQDFDENRNIGTVRS